MTNAMLNQTYGVEIEMYNITRSQAAKVVCKKLNELMPSASSHGPLWQLRHEGGGYDAYVVYPVFDASQRWLIERDASILAETDWQKVELVTPVLKWVDMEVLQEVLRALRKAGARSDPLHQCGIHVHVSGDGHTPESLRNLANIMASHEALLQQALQLSHSRCLRWCKPVDPKFVQRVNAEKPTTMSDLKQCWYQANGAPYGQDAHYNKSRYHMLNLHSYFQGKGLEFRLFQFDNYDPNAPKGRRGGIHAGAVKAYVQLALALSQAAKDATRANPKPHTTDNPKYAMRCWLLRLGFIGDEFTTARDILTRRLPGDAAFRHGRPNTPNTAAVAA